MNANNNANNENMATAGRRRALKRLQRLKDFMTGTTTTTTSKPLSDILIGFRPIKVGYLDRQKRDEKEKLAKETNIDRVAEESSLTALIYIDALLKLLKLRASQKGSRVKDKSGDCMARLICCAAKASVQLGDLGTKLAGTFKTALVQVLNLSPEMAIKSHDTGQKLQNCNKIYATCRRPQIKCEE